MRVFYDDESARDPYKDKNAHILIISFFFIEIVLMCHLLLYFDPTVWKWVYTGPNQDRSIDDLSETSSQIKITIFIKQSY